VKVTKKSEYAVRALIEIVIRSHSDKQWHQISQIASATDIPDKFLEQILLTLKRGGLLQSRRGIDGGYALNVPAAKMTLDQVILALEGSMMAEMTKGSGDEGLDVFIECVGDAEKAAIEVLSSQTIEDLARRAEEKRQQRSDSMEFQI